MSSVFQDDWVEDSMGEINHENELSVVSHFEVIDGEVSIVSHFQDDW